MKTLTLILSALLLTLVPAQAKDERSRSECTANCGCTGSCGGHGNGHAHFQERIPWYLVSFGPFLNWLKASEVNEPTAKPSHHVFMQ